MRFLYFLFVPSIFWGSICVPLSMDLETGYRQDHLHIKTILPENNLGEEKYKRVKFWQNNLTLRTVQRDIYLLLSGGYGVFGKGFVEVSPPHLDFTNTSTFFRLETKGNTYHVKGVFGYGVNLTPERYYRVALTPLVGYEALWENLQRMNPSPSVFQGIITPGQSPTFTASLEESQENLNTSWKGFFVGGNLWIAPGGPFSMKLDYGYHFMTLHQRFFQQQNTSRFSSAGSLVNQEKVTYSSRVRKNGAHGHSGSIALLYLLAKHWNLSVKGDIFYYFSTVQGIQMKKVVETIFPTVSTTAQNLSTRFDSTQLTLAGFVMITRIF